MKKANRLTLGPLKALEADRWGAVVFFCLAVVVLNGCLGGGRSEAPPVSSYMIEYTAPVETGTPVADAAITIRRFSAADLYTQRAMLFREGPFTRSAYNYHRWEISPAAMISDLLYRDLTQAGLFSAVRSELSYEKSRYFLEGHITEFLEISEGNRRAALLAFTATLSDRTMRETNGQVLFQNTYKTRVPLDENTPAGLARSMSRAMEELSKRLIQDIRAAVEKR